jgi:uncharacterized protein HemY
MTMKLVLKIASACALVVVLVGIGAFAIKTFDEEARQASATSFLLAAQASLKEGDKARALYFAGSATGLSRSAFVLASAAEVAIEAGDQQLARELLADATRHAEKEDVSLVRKVQERLDRSSK